MLAMEVRESLNTQDRAEHLTAETGVMATCHLLGIAEQVAGNPSDTQSAFRQLWEKYGVKRAGTTSAVCS